MIRHLQAVCCTSCSICGGEHRPNFRIRGIAACEASVGSSTGVDATGAVLYHILVSPTMLRCASLTPIDRNNSIDNSRSHKIEALCTECTTWEPTGLHGPPPPPDGRRITHRWGVLCRGPHLEERQRARDKAQREVVEWEMRGVGWALLYRPIFLFFVLRCGALGVHPKQPSVPLQLPPVAGATAHRRRLPPEYN